MNAAQKRAKEAEKALMSIARRLDKSMQRDDAQMSGQYMGMIQGMKDLAKRVGTPCTCEIRTGEKKRLLRVSTTTSCICAATAKELREKYIKRNAEMRKSQTYRRSVVVHQFEGRR